VGDHEKEAKSGHGGLTGFFPELLTLNKIYLP
jgi:hypothetical protein